jgi:hypothetical protein
VYVYVKKTFSFPELSATRASDCNGMTSIFVGEMKLMMNSLLFFIAL